MWILTAALVSILNNTSQVVLVVKNSLVSAGEIRETGWIPAWGRSLEEEMATRSSIRVYIYPDI